MSFSTKIEVGGKSVWVNVPKNTEAWQKANSIFCPLGPAPTQAWFVMLKIDLDELISQNGSSPITVTWTVYESDDDPETPSVTSTVTSFPGLYILDAERLKPGGVNDRNGLFLVELGDARTLASRKSDCGVVISNIRTYANDNEFLPETTQYNTWDYLVKALWDACGLFGAYPSLPGDLPIDGAPNNTWLIGLNSWRCLTAVLDQLDCAVCRNPLTNEFSICQLGANQNIFPLGYNDTLKFDGEPKTPNVAQAAANLNIYFVFHRKSYGQELDTEYNNNWAWNGQGNIVNVATGIDGSQGTIALWDDLSWILDENNSNDNATAIQTRANNRKARYATRYSVTPQHKIHRGIRQDYLPGSQIKAVLWRNWGDKDENRLGGTVTEFVCCSNPISGINTSGGSVAWLDAQLVGPEREQYGPPDLGRKTYPNYPHLSNIVQVSSGLGVNDGTTVQAANVNSNGVRFHRGKVKKFISGGINTLDSCWILFVDDYNNKGGNVPGIEGEFYGPARLSGMVTCSGERLPVYVVQKGVEEPGTLVFFQLFAVSSDPEPILGLAGNCAALLLKLNVTTGQLESTGTLITVVDPFRNPGEWQGMTGLRGIAMQRGDTINERKAYDIVWMERPALLTTGQLQTGVPDNFNTYGEPISSSLFHYQQGEKAPPEVGAVWDSLGLYPRALGVDGLDSQSEEPAPGAKFIASWNDRQNELDFLVSQQQTFYCSATLMNNLRRDDALGRARDIKVQMFSPFNLAPRYSVQNGLSFRNPRGLIGLEGSECLLLWNEETEDFSVVSIDPGFLHGFVELDEVADGVLVDTAESTLAGIFVGSISLNNPATECGIRFQSPTSFDSKVIATGGKWYAAKLVNFEGVTPVYDAIATDQEWEGHYGFDSAKGTSPAWTLHNGDGSDSSITLVAKLRYKKYKANKKAIIKNLNGTMIANQIEC